MAKRRKKKNTSLMTGLIAIIGVITVLLGSSETSFSSFFNNEEDTETTISDNSTSSSDAKTVNSETYEVSDGLEVYFLDVGQADSILIRNNGLNMLIDAGNNEDGSKLVTYFESLGITSFEYVVGTHAHEDHIGGMDNIIKSFDIKTFYMPSAITTTKTFEDVLDALEAKNYSLSTPQIGDEFSFGDCYFEVLYVGDNAKDLNNTSIMLLLKYGEKRFLFTGDAEEAAETTLLNKDIKADVLKVGHHGSETSTSLSFLQKVNPEYAVIEVGTGNSYNHPRSETLTKLNDMNIKIYRTDESGTILFTSDGTNLNVTTFKTDTNG